MKTGIFIRAQIDSKWESIDIGDPKLPDTEVLNWLRSGGGRNILAERCVMILLNRNPKVVDMV